MLGQVLFQYRTLWIIFGDVYAFWGKNERNLRWFLIEFVIELVYMVNMENYYKSCIFLFLMTSFISQMAKKALKSESAASSTVKGKQPPPEPVGKPPRGPARWGQCLLGSRWKLSRVCSLFFLGGAGRKRHSDTERDWEGEDSQYLSPYSHEMGQMKASLGWDWWPQKTGFSVCNTLRKWPRMSKLPLFKFFVRCLGFLYEISQFWILTVC